MAATNQSFATLISAINNSHQKQSLQRLLCRTEDDRLYMDGFVPAATADAHIGTFHVMGAVRKGAREKYNICMYGGGDGGGSSSEPQEDAPPPHPTFTCSCMDYKLNSTRMQRVCKHICFVICKFGGIYDPTYFNAAAPKLLLESHIQTLTQKAQRLVEAGTVTAAVGDDAELRECFQSTASPITPRLLSSPPPPTQVVRNMPHYPMPPAGLHFRLGHRAVWDGKESCPICFDDVDNDETRAVACPTCHNVIHRECMMVWLERKNTCVFCRDSVWRWYRTVNK